jgi:hypothetical protein
VQTRCIPASQHSSGLRAREGRRYGPQPQRPGSRGKEASPRARFPPAAPPKGSRPEAGKTSPRRVDQRSPEAHPAGRTNPRRSISAGPVGAGLQVASSPSGPMTKAPLIGARRRSRRSQPMPMGHSGSGEIGTERASRPAAAAFARSVSLEVGPPRLPFPERASGVSKLVSHRRGVPTAAARNVTPPTWRSRVDLARFTGGPERAPSHPRARGKRGRSEATPRASSARAWHPFPHAPVPQLQDSKPCGRGRRIRRQQRWETAPAARERAPHQAAGSCGHVLPPRRERESVVGRC